MTFWFTTTQQQQQPHVSEELLLRNSIQSYIEQNGDLYRNDELLHIAYIGQHDPTVNFKPPQITAAGKETTVNPVLEFFGLAAAGLCIVAVGVGVLLTYRHRRCRQSEAEPPGIDLDVETGAFPCLAPASGGNRHLDDDEEIQEEYHSAPPSSLAAIGGASVLARQLNYCPQRSTPAEEESIQSNITEDHSGDVLDEFAPMILDTDSNKSSDKVSVESSVFNDLDQDNKKLKARPVSPSVVSAGDMHGGSSSVDNLDEDNDQLLGAAFAAVVAGPPMSLTEDDHAEPYEDADEPQKNRRVI